MRRAWGVVTLVMTVAALVVPVTSTADVQPREVAVLAWARALPHALTTGARASLDTSWEPGHGGVTSFGQQTDHGSVSAVTRWSIDGARRWTVHWAGPRRVVRDVRPQAVSFQWWRQSIFIGGDVRCRLTPDRTRVAYLQKYSLQGELLWTHWMARCPTSQEGRVPRDTRVSDLHVLGSFVALAVNHLGTTASAKTVDGGLFVYNLRGNRLWKDTVEPSDAPATNDRTLAVSVGVGGVVVGGWVETASRSAATPPVDRQAFAMSFDFYSGEPQWTSIVSDSGAPDRDAISAAGRGAQREFVGGYLDRQYSTRRAGTAFIEQRHPQDGHVVWNDVWPSQSRVAGVEGVGHDRAVAAGTIATEAGRRILLRRYLPDGTIQWTSEWGHPGTSVSLKEFSLMWTSGAGIGVVSEGPGTEARARLWRWDW